MKLFKVAFSNIRKRKSSAITLLAITAIAVLMLSISLSLILGLGNFYNAKATELNMPHAGFFIANDNWDDGMLSFAENYDGIKEVELNDIYMGNVKCSVGDKTIKARMVFGNDDDKRTMDIVKPIDKLAVKPENSILFALSFKYDGVKSGDAFTINSGSKTYNFIVYGFFEDIQLGNAMSTLVPAYVSSGIFEEISEDNNLSPYKRFSVMLKNSSDTYGFLSEFLEAYPLESNSFYNTAADGQFRVTMFPFIMSMVLILVSIVVIIIALIIARFSIINNIEEDIKTLGALKSLGFTSKQIILSMTLQFLMITLAGVIAGVLIALGLSGTIGNIISSTSGLLWSGASMLLPTILAVLFVVGIVVLITYLMAGKSKKITPINALRAGLNNHTFIKNTVPLEKTKMPVNVSMAAKQFLGNLKNNIAVFIVVILFAFMTILTSTLYYNFVVDTTAFNQMAGIELVEVLVSANTEEFAAEHFDEIASKPGIRKTARLDDITLTYENIAIRCFVWEDISQMETINVISGKVPKEENEIAIPVGTANGLGKQIGDRINLKYEGAAYNYLITGFTQGVNNNSLMTEQGFSNLKQDVVLKWLFIYLDSSEPQFIEDFMNALIDDYGRNIYIENSIENMSNVLSSIENPIALASYLIVAVTVFIICFVLFLMANTLISRRKKDSGIMKALGFTSGQLRLQMLLSFLPSILGGILIGAILGITLTNPLLGIMFGGLGVAKATFTIPVILTLVAEILLGGVCLATISLVSFKLKNIAPQKLIVEG